MFLKTFFRGCKLWPKGICHLIFIACFFSFFLSCGEGEEREYGLTQIDTLAKGVLLYENERYAVQVSSLGRILSAVDKQKDSMELSSRFLSPDFIRDEPLFLGLIHQYLLLSDGIKESERDLWVYDLDERELCYQIPYAEKVYPKQDILQIDEKNNMVRFFYPLASKVEKNYLPKATKALQRVIDTDPEFMAYAVEMNLQLSDLDTIRGRKYVYMPLY